MSPVPNTIGDNKRALKHHMPQVVGSECCTHVYTVVCSAPTCSAAMWGRLEHRAAVAEEPQQLRILQHHSDKGGGSS